MPPRVEPAASRARTRRIRLIVFSGVDGAGKSTQIELLRRALAQTGVLPRSFWARGGYTPTLNFLKSSLRRLRPGALPPPGPSAEREQRMSSQRTRRLWLFLAISDLFFWYVVALRLRLLLGATVLCDRYLEDTALDFSRNFPSEPFERWWSWRLLRKLAPQPQLRFLLLVPPAESARRSALKNEPFPDSTATLQWRHSGYQAIAAQDAWIVVDCMQSVDEVHRVIRGYVLP